MLNQHNCKSAKLIVCILARGKSQEVLEALEKSGQTLASKYMPIRSQRYSTDEWVEMDSLHIMVKQKHAKPVFALLYDMADIESCQGASMYQINVPFITPFELPDIPKEGVEISSLQNADILPDGIDDKTAENLRTLADIDPPS